MPTIYPPANAPALNSRIQSIRKTTVAFSSLFKDIPFTKYDENGIAVEKFKVPIVYSNKEKYVKRIDGDPGEIDEKIQITLPRIEYGLLNVQYDPSRKINQANKISGCDSNGSSYVGAPTPYNFNFEVTLYTRNIEEANQIMEYILPFFNADYNILVNMVPELKIVKSIPITFTGETEEEDSTGISDSSIRSVFRTLSFTARSFIYPAPKYYKPILQAETNIYLSDVIKLSYDIIANTGLFQIGDIVYQGESFNRALAVAQVIDYNSYKQTIVLLPKLGNLKSNTQIINTFGTANGTIINQNNQLALKSTITPVPNTYPASIPFDYNIKIDNYTG